MLMKVMRRQHGRQDRHAGFELQRHQAVDNSGRDEFVAVDAAIDHQRAAHDGRVLTRVGQTLGMQRNLEGAWHVEHIDGVRRHAEALHLSQECVACLVHDVLMPLGFNECDAVASRRVGRSGDGKGKVVDLTHGASWVPLAWRAGFLNQGARRRRRCRATRRARQCRRFALSCIRTVTVGFGFTPKSADPEIR